jgi:hypothetical protein
VAKKLFIQFLIWLLVILSVSFLGLTLLPVVTQESYHLQSRNLSFWQRWANWDGGAYLTIAEKGYNLSRSEQYAFFPFYPLVIKIVNLVFRSYLLSGLLVSWAACFLTIYFLYKLVLLDFSNQIAQRTVNYFLIFPFSFFLLATYSESLFLLLAISSFYFLRKSSYAKASVLGMLATATRASGIALIPALTAEALEKTKFKIKRQLAYLIILPLGFSSYLWYQQRTTGNPFFFIKAVQQYWQRDQFTLPFKVILSYFIHFQPADFFQFRDNTLISLEIIISLLFLFLILISWRKLRKSYFWYSFFVWSLPLMTGRSGSILRYVLAAFPCFIILAILGKNKNFDQFYTLLSSFLLGLFVVSFINGYWVA